MKSILINYSLEGKANLIRLIAGAAIFAAGIVLDNTIQPYPLTLTAFIIAYIILGYDIILRSAGNLLRGQIFDENFLMTIATAGAFIIGESPEAAGVMLFYQIGEYFQQAAVKKSRKSITELMDIRPDYANLLKEGVIEKVAPGAVNAGDKIIVKPGEKIPLDGVVIEGVSLIDASALTGESVPKKADVSSAVLSGCVNLSGKLTIEVTKTFGESTVSKIINLVENSADKKAKTENFITKFARVYTPCVVTLAVLLCVIPPLFFAGDWNVWIHRALVFLVISCPCALVLSIPMGFFAGIGRAAGNGILIKGGNYLEAFNKLGTVVFDKTGTLTNGVFQVTEIKPAGGFSENGLLELASRAEIYSNHPVALSVMNEYSQRKGQSLSSGGGTGTADDQIKISDYKEIAGYGVSVKLDGLTVLAGNRKLMEKNQIDLGDDGNHETGGGARVYAAKDGMYAGCIIIADEVKPDSAAAVSALKKRGVSKTVMLTGDSDEIARKVAGETGIDEVYSQLLPHEKVECLERLSARKNASRAGLKNSKNLLAFVGDGINDAPSLAIADVGVAMGALGSDAAIEAADVVLMTDEPSKLCRAMDIAKITAKIVRQNIIFTLCVKIVFLSLGAFGIASMWEAVFADAGVSLLAVLNAMRIMKVKLNSC